MSEDKRRIRENKTKEVIQPEIEKEDRVPPGVKNEEAWYQYMKLRNATIMNEDYRIVKTSDPNTEIDLITPAVTFRKRYKHLPEEEKNEIERRAKAIKVVLGKLASLKNKAFGIQQKGQYSFSETILDPRVSELIELFGRFYSTEEVHKVVVDDWGYPVSRDLIGRFQKRHIDKIKERQEEFKRDYSDIRLGYKRSRLDELEWLYRTRKEKYEQSHSAADYKLLLQTLEAIKKEVEVDVLRIEGDINHKIETTINVHVQQDLFKDMTINDIIVGRVAAKAGLNAAYMIERLHTSYYAKHSGFNPGDKHASEEEISYPSSIVYNWEAIKKKHTEEKRLLDEQKKPTVIEDAQVIEDSNNIKEALLARVKKAKGDVNEAKGRIEDREKGE
jgi:hypothetical protein